MKLELFTPKVSKRFETVYYYKQKFVNWEFSAPSGYTSKFVVPIIETKSKEFFGVLALQSDTYPYKINLYRYATEQSYKTHAIFYQVTAINTNTYDNTETINKIICDNTNFLIQDNTILNTANPNTTFTKIISSESALNSFEKNLKFTSTVTFDRYSALFKKNIIQKFNTYPVINLHSDTLIIPTLEKNKGHSRTNIKTVCLSTKAYVKFSNSNLTILDNTFLMHVITRQSILKFAAKNIFKNGINYNPRIQENITNTYKNLSKTLVSRSISMSFSTAGTLN